MSVAANSASPSRSGKEKARPDGQNVTKILNRELMHLLTSPPPGISAFPANPDSLFLWSATVSGPPDSPYEGIEWKLEIKFGGSYPIKAPEVKFQKGVWHPNVDLESGAICLDILKDKWSAVYTAEKILISIQALLAEPNNDSPLNPAAAQLWDGAPREETTKMVRKKWEEFGGKA